MNKSKKILIGLVAIFLLPITLLAQGTTIDTSSWYTQPGIIGTMVLCIIVLIVFSFISVIRIDKLLNVSNRAKSKNQERELKDAIVNSDSAEIEELLESRRKSGRYKLKGNELAGAGAIKDNRGLINQVTQDPNNPFVDEKKIGKISFQTDDKLIHLIL